MRYAILEWDIKDRRWAVREEMDGCKAKRAMSMRYKVLCARYPNNSFRLTEMTERTLDERVVHRDAETKAIAEAAR